MTDGMREEHDHAREKVDVDGVGKLSDIGGQGGVGRLDAAAGVAHTDEGVSGAQVAASGAGADKAGGVGANASPNAGADKADGVGGAAEFDEGSGYGRSEEERRRSPLGSYLLYLAWVVSVVATLGSLYFSEIRGFIPCELCWYQRILMYPLSVILGIAAYHNDLRIKKYVLPFSIIGTCVSLYHYMLQKVPGFALARPCVQGVPCDAMYINWFGFITIPFLALVAFILITICLLAIRKRG